MNQNFNDVQYDQNMHNGLKKMLRKGKGRKLLKTIRRVE